MAQTEKMVGREKGREGMTFTIDPETLFHLLDFERLHAYTQTQSFTLRGSASMDLYGTVVVESGRDNHYTQGQPLQEQYIRLL